MTLTAHAIVGAAIASTLPHEPALAFGLALASHFVLDAIPHGDYPLRSASINPHIAARMKYDRALLTDLLKIAVDAGLGVALSAALFGATLLIALGVAGGMLPDFLQFVWMRFKHEPFTSLQRFHHLIHTDNHLIGRPLFGFVSQAAFLVAIISLAKLYF